MKTKIIPVLTLIILLIIYSCEKIEFRRDISGTWNTFFAGGGLSLSEIKTNYTSLRLTSHNRYSIFNYDTLKASGKYTLFESGYKNNKYYEPFYIKFEKGSPYDAKLVFPIEGNLDISIFNSDTIAFSPRDISDGLQFFFTKSK